MHVHGPRQAGPQLKPTLGTLEEVLLLAFAILGLAILLLGVVALRHLWRTRDQIRQSILWRIGRSIAIALSIALAVASVFISYPYRTPEGAGRIVGFPFVAAYFDHAGFDYVGLITYPAALGNALVWFSVPWIALAACGRIAESLRHGA